jgi:hypothetical protein
VAGALILSTILVGAAVQAKAADSTGKQTAAKHGFLTEKQAKALAGRAETRADHLKLAAYFNSESAKFDTEAKHHEELAEVYRTTGGVTLAGKNSGAGDLTRSSGHCDAIAKSLRDAAASSRDLLPNTSRWPRKPPNELSAVRDAWEIITPRHLRLSRDS